MTLPDEAVKEFIKIYEEEFGEKLSMEKGREYAQKLFDFCKIIYKPIPHENKSPPKPR